MNAFSPHFRPLRPFATIVSLALLTAANAYSQAQMPNMSRARQGQQTRNTLFQASLQFTSGINVSVQGSSFQFAGFPPGPEAGPATERLYGDGFVAVDFEGNLNDLTADWGFLNESQVDLVNDTLTFNSFGYEEISDLTTEKDGGGLAIDLSLNRSFLRPARNLWIGLQGGFQIGPIDAKGGFNTEVPVIQRIDTYSLNGFTPPTAPYLSGPTEDANGNPFPAAKIGSIPLTSSVVPTQMTSTLDSRYDVSGGYYGFRLGPMINFKPTDWMGLQLSAGASVVLATAEFNYNEVFSPPDGSNDIFTHAVAKTDDWLTGYYAEASLQFWLNRRAGIFINGIMQKNDQLDMATERQLATVDFESNTSIGFGVFYTF